MSVLPKQSARTTAAGQPKKGSGSKRAYERIRSQILSLALAPGTDFDEQDLVRTLKLSRTPIREALIQLSAEGLVEILPNRGARVSRVDLAGVREFFEALDVIQRMVTKWASLRRTLEQVAEIELARDSFVEAMKAGDIEKMTTTNMELHEAIGRACGNSLIAKQYSHLLAFGIRLSRLSLAYGDDSQASHIQSIADEHDEMVRSIASRDAEAAERLAREHTERFRARVYEYVGSGLGADIRF